MAHVYFCVTNKLMTQRALSLRYLLFQNLYRCDFYRYSKATASNDLTRSSVLGGDWELEIATGSIESQSAIDTDVMNSYGSLLVTYSDSDHQLSSPGLSWEEAQAEAESLGGNLVSIDNAEEQQWLEDNFGTTEVLGIGYSDRANEGEYQF